MHGNCCNCKDERWRRRVLNIRFRFLFLFFCSFILPLGYACPFAIRSSFYRGLCLFDIVLSFCQQVYYYVSPLVWWLIIYVFRCRDARAHCIGGGAAASNGTKIGIVCISHSHKRPGSDFVRIPLRHACSWFVAMAFCSRQPTDVRNGKGEMDF